MKNKMRRYRNDGEAVSPVIGTILMVAITVVLAAVLYIVVGPMINPPDDKPQENFLLRQGAVTGNQTVLGTYDTFFTVMVVSSVQKYPDPDLSFVIMSDDGSLLTDATIYYDDANDNGYVSEGDSILVRGMTLEYHGATLKVLYHGSMICQKSVFVQS
jgi:flagellin-like protein